MIYSTANNLIANNPKKIYLGGNISDEFISTCYNYKNDTFGLLFRQYTSSTVEKNYHPSIVEEWRSDTDKSGHEDNLHKGVYITSEKIELDQIMNLDQWLIWVLDEIKLYQFQGIF